ncbi:MAG: class I SAM-dependent methyltransferase [Candidatus Tyrphobacter sp.]
MHDSHRHKPGEGAKQHEIFSHERAAVLDEPEREQWTPAAALVELLDAPSQARVLDFGTGTGRYAIALARARPDLNVVAYDVQPEMLDIVRRRAADAHVENLSGANWAEAQRRAPYDRIVALNVLHEIDNVTLRRLAPLLAPGGSVLFVDWDATIDRPTGPPAEHAHSPSEAQERLTRNGLARVERIRDARFPYHFILRAS